MKNAIFQYMILTPEVDQHRGKIKGHTRSEVYKDCANISRESFADYADKIDADYYYSDEAKFIGDVDYTSDSTALLFECLRVIYDPLFDQYDKVLFADTDIVVNTEEDIFDLCDDGDVFGVLESDFVTANGGGYNTWDFKQETLLEFTAKMEQHGVPLVPVLPPSKPSKLTILNTGVVVWTREARLRARELFMPWTEWFFAKPEYHMSIMNDQPYISGQLMLHDFDLVSLDQTWNDSPHYASEEEFFEKAKMCHYTGGAWKIDMINHHKDKKYKYFPY
jgi:lipopolysaccharide biosynthesis glycosyltransferase